MLLLSPTIDDDQEGDIVAKHIDGLSLYNGQVMAKLGRMKRRGVLQSGDAPSAAGAG
ncbi:unnamed protein product [Brugia pahangi]|uniref:DNA-directed RNA polymerase n=1 Tax=Brugia pahangi TaxID=6280 RepID=A0A0N4TCG8_BRUPA|nr:unnamed protein product [Brugia pahangi]